MNLNDQLKALKEKHDLKDSIIFLCLEYSEEKTKDQKELIEAKLKEYAKISHFTPKHTARTPRQFAEKLKDFVSNKGGAPSAINALYNSL